MVKTRSAQNEDELTKKVDELKKENESLLNQLKLIESEYDDLRCRLSQHEMPNTKKKKNKKKTQPNSLKISVSSDKNIDTEDCERKIYNDILLAMIPETQECPNVSPGVSLHVQEADIGIEIEDTERKIFNDIALSLISDNSKSTHENEFHANTESETLGYKSDDSVRIIGTSMMRAMGLYCHEKGVKACSFAYPGATVSDVSNNIHSYLQSDRPPANIVLHAGGNDLEISSIQNTSNSMDILIQRVKAICPNSNIILSALTPRKQDGLLNLKIAEFNKLLKLKSN
jgi:regulator of replication initiation timing